MGLGKGALRKMWSSAKDAVLRNKTLTKDEKTFMSVAFKDDLGPKLDDFESLAGKGRSDKLMLAFEKVNTTIEAYGRKLDQAHHDNILNEDDCKHLVDILKKVKGVVGQTHAEAMKR